MVPLESSLSPRYNELLIFTKSETNHELCSIESLISDLAHKRYFLPDKTSKNGAYIIKKIKLAFQSESGAKMRSA